MSEGTRPTVDLVKNAYNHIFNSGLSLSRIQDAALDGRLFQSFDTTGVPGRSIAWKLFLVPNEPLGGAPQSRPNPPLESLRSARAGYVELLLEKMRAPDGSYADGFSIPGPTTFPKRKPGVAGSRLGLEMNNPLSLHNENPWTQWFASVELRRTISQDVERTFPEIGYFRDDDVQSQLTNVLFLYAVTHPSIGYRQGMHELLAPLYYAVDYDSISEDANPLVDDHKIRELCSRAWVVADAWVLFEAVMRGVSQWYEWRKTPQSDLSLPAHVAIHAPDGRIDMKPHVIPIVEACNEIQSTHLRRVDPLLWETMHATGIEPQIYGIRWLRLLFTREFSMDDAMILWDGLFACDPTFELAQWICVAMLMRIRNHLIPSDYSNQLTYLLRYPPVPSPKASNFDCIPHHATLLLRQALALRMSPTPATGVSVVSENHNILNISIVVPDAPTGGQSRNRTREKSASSEKAGNHLGGNKVGHNRQASSPQLGLPELIARNLLDRGESLGINKTLMSAVSELRRNLPELAASIIRPASTSYAAFPLVDERLGEERPPWEPRTHFQMERDASDLRKTNKRLGESLGWIVDTLLQDDGDITDPEGLKHIKKRKCEALESLSYVRDILMGNVTNINEDRLVGEEELKDRKTKVTPSIESQHNISVEVPRPVPTTDSRFNVAPPSSSYPPNTTTRNPSPLLQGPNTRLAPWNYTRSSFSQHDGPSLPPASTLPRLPPPTSTNFGPLNGSSSRRRTNYDPLGVIP